MGIFDLFKKNNVEVEKQPVQRNDEYSKNMLAHMYMKYDEAEKRSNFDLRETVDLLKDGWKYIAINDGTRVREFVGHFDKNTHQIDTSKEFTSLSEFSLSDKKVIYEKVFGKEALSEGIMDGVKSIIKTDKSYRTIDLDAEGNLKQRLDETETMQARAFAKGIDNDKAELVTYASDDGFFRVTDVNYNADNKAMVNHLAERLFEGSAVYQNISEQGIPGLSETIEYKDKTYNLGDFDKEDRINLRHASGEYGFLDVSKSVVEENNRALYYESYKEHQVEDYSFSDYKKDLSSLGDNIGLLSESGIFVGDVVRQFAQVEKSVNSSELSTNQNIKETLTALKQDFNGAASKDQDNYMEAKKELTHEEKLEQRKAEYMQQHNEKLAAYTNKDNEAEKSNDRHKAVEQDMDM